MGKRRVSSGNGKLSGISVPLHVKLALEEIVAVETEAFREMGGETKFSLSDHISNALETYVRDWLSDNGTIPQEGTAARAEYVKTLAARNLAKLREQLMPSKH